MQPNTRSQTSGRHFLPKLMAAMLLVVGPGCKGWDGNGDAPPVTQYYPALEMSGDSLDYDDIRVGQYYYKTIVIGNQGRVNLEIDSMTIEGDDRAAYAFELDKSHISPGGQAFLKITYTPPAQGIDDATLTLHTNDPDFKDVAINLAGNGVLPVLELSSELVSFSGVAAGEVVSEDLEIANMGTGALIIQDIDLPPAFGDAFSIQLPNTFEPGFVLQPELSLKVRVTYHPPLEVLTGEEAEEADDTPVTHEGELFILTDDPKQSTVSVQLWGTSQPPPADPPPTAEIDYPVEGSRVYLGNMVRLSGKVSDEYDDLNQLAVSWSSSLDGIIGYSIPDEEGNVHLDTPNLSVGDHLITLYVYDASAQPGFDQAELKVWNDDSEFEYIIAGQFSEYSYINVDDNIEVYRIDQDTGAEVPCLVVFDDIAHAPGTAGPPISPTVCNVRRGDQIRIIAYDRYAADARLDAIYLYYRDEEFQPLVTQTVGFTTGVNGETCLESPSKHEWYGTYDYPYTGDCVFYDETFTVQIPAIPVDESE